MGFKDIEQRRSYDRDLRRRRRAEQSGKAEVKPPASVGNAYQALNPPLSPKVKAESPSAAVATQEKFEMPEQIDGQVHLLTGMTVLRHPSIVFEQSKRLLEEKGWCMWRYPTLDNMVWIILRDERVSGYPPNFHTLTCNPERSLDIELKMNIPGCLN